MTLASGRSNGYIEQIDCNDLKAGLPLSCNTHATTLLPSYPLTVVNRFAVTASYPTFLATSPSWYIAPAEVCRLTQVHTNTYKCHVPKMRRNSFHEKDVRRVVWPSRSKRSIARARSWLSGEQNTENLMSRSVFGLKWYNDYRLYMYKRELYLF